MQKGKIERGQGQEMLKELLRKDIVCLVAECADKLRLRFVNGQEFEISVAEIGQLC
ncbi:MAG: hypothetical protein IJX88_01270 [Clostridia bacterium]|nr:hypothetical protein [Clostridia bacterium]